MKTLIILLMAATCYGSTAWENSLAGAIFKAENSKTHPYGIMQTYKTTTPRQACINSIRTNVRLWKKSGCQGDFIDAMARRYCPRGDSRDVFGLNDNWSRNVKTFMKQSKQPLNPL